VRFKAHLHRANAGGEWRLEFPMVHLVADVTVIGVQDGDVAVIHATVNQVLFGPWFLAAGDTLEFVNTTYFQGAPSFIAEERCLAFLTYSEPNRRWYILPTPGYKLSPLQVQERRNAAEPEYKYFDAGERRVTNAQVLSWIVNLVRANSIGSLNKRK
jgi:hypothetical protein